MDQCKRVELVSFWFCNYLFPSMFSTWLLTRMKERGESVWLSVLVWLSVCPCEECHHHQCQIWNGSTEQYLVVPLPICTTVCDFCFLFQGLNSVEQLEVKVVITKSYPVRFKLCVIVKQMGQKIHILTAVLFLWCWQFFNMGAIGKTGGMKNCFCVCLFQSSCLKCHV